MRLAVTGGSLQFAVAWLSIRSSRVYALVKSEPRLLLHRGRILDGALRAERVSRAEVLQAIRSQRHRAAEDVEAVVLETDGSMSVLPRDGGQPSVLSDVREAPRREGAAPVMR